MTSIEQAAVVTRRPTGITHMRWVIAALLVVATTIAYVDRSVFSYLEKYLQGVVPGLCSIQYGHIQAGFLFAYAIGLVIAGGLTDKLGTRLFFPIAMVLWSVAAMIPAAASTVIGFGVAMFVLGLAEAANYPACVKTVAEWFPQSERALATGLFNAGSSIGTVIVPFVVVFFFSRFGWRAAFVGTGTLGFVWLAFWLVLYRKPENHPRVSEAELRLIERDRPTSAARIRWRSLLPVKETWAFALGKFCTDPIWWFWIFWLPRYLQGTFHLDLQQSRWPIATVYLLSVAGSVLAGWLPAVLMRRGWTPNAARKGAMLLCALSVVPVFYAPYSRNLWVVVGLTGLAVAAHQGFGANLFTLPSDVFPRGAVASVFGIGGMVGAMGAALFQDLAGNVIARTNSYLSLFVIACSAYLIALLIIHLLTPRLSPARIRQD